MSERDSIEIVHEPGAVGLIANHGPLEVTLSFNPDQAEQLAAAMLDAAKKARAAAAEKTKGAKPS